MRETLSFAAYLENRLRDDAPKLKGERTRARLKIAAANVLGEKGYHAMRVSDVTERAGVAEGSFYVYFDDKKEISLTVLSALLEDFFKLSAPPETARSPFDSIRASNRRWIALCRANAGLMRCIFQLGDEEPDFSRLVQRTNREWYGRVSRSVLRRHKDLAQETALLAIYFLGAMMDEVVRKLVVYPDPEFIKVIKSMRANDDAVADAASIIWLRILDAGMMPPDDLPPTAAKLAKIMWV